jgi:hypothetical protein
MCVLGRRTYCQALSNGDEPHSNFKGEGSGVLSCKSFFSFFPWLVASLFLYSESALLLAGYGPCGCRLESSDLPFSEQLVLVGCRAILPSHP